MYEKKEYPQYNKNPLTLKYNMSWAEMIIFVNCLTSKTKLLKKHCLQASTSMHNMNTESAIGKKCIYAPFAGIMWTCA